MHLLAHARDVAEGAPRLGGSLGWIDAVGDQLLAPLFQVIANLLLHLVVEAIAPQECPEAPDYACMSLPLTVLGESR